ncbi:MAG TPA: hypothetical protein VGR03_05100 [Candidatus Acidoferrum sp.]|nr:hypothetical protein [Candidatus Acidoferrum sp.]
MWRQYESGRAKLSALEPGLLEALPGSLTGLIGAIKERQTYKRYYEAVADYSFMAVPIASLVAPQWGADLDFVDEIVSASSKDMNIEQQLLFAMSEGKITEPIVTGNQVWFTSPRRDLFAHPVPTVREIGEGEFEIVIRAASRPNYIQVAAVENRLLLTNGVHKVCALHKMGYTHCVCVFRRANDLTEAGIDQRQTTLFRDAVFKSMRPALVTDFLEPLAAAPLKMRAMYQVLQIAFSVGTITVPALPKNHSTQKPRVGAAATNC